MQLMATLTRKNQTKSERRLRLKCGVAIVVLFGLIPLPLLSSSMLSVRRSLLQRGLLLLAILVYALLFQGSRALYSPDEGRYTDVALGMLDSGDWLRPMVHPGIAHWTKPPLTYWAIAASVALFGYNEFAARLPNALCFAGTILLLLRTGRRLTPVQPWRPALIYATFIFPFFASNIVTTDTLLTLFEALQFSAFAELWWAKTPDAERRAARMLWLGAGLAFMTKGPPGLLMLAGFLVFAAIESGWRGPRRLLRWDALPIFIAVGFTWYAVAVIRDPQVLHYFLVEEVVNRVASDKMHRNGAWYDGFKIYLPVLLIGTLPWLPLAAVRTWRAHRSLLTYWTSSVWTRWLTCCIVVPLAVFMISRSRLPLYILPLFVPLACLIALRTGSLRLNSDWRRASMVAWCVALVIVRGAASHLTLRDDDKRLADQLVQALPATPAEISFVETAPRYGMRFYLGSMIERLTLPGHDVLTGAVSFDSEIHKDVGCRVLMVDAANLPETLAALAAANAVFRRSGQVQDYTVFILESPSCAAYSKT